MTMIYPRASLAADPPSLYPDYVGTRLRAPSQPLVLIPHTLSELTGPVYGHESVLATDSDLTRQHAGAPLGERIIVTGRVMDEDGRPLPDTLIEIWQANAAGRYVHVVDQHPAPLDPNFTGAGRAVTDAEGRYRFTTVKPGAYPWRNHPQCLAAGAYPSLAVRADLPDASGDADVFSGRPALPVRSDLQFGSRRKGARPR